MGNSEITLLIVRCQQNITTTSEARGNSHSKLQADGWIWDWGEATYLGTSLLQCSSSSTDPGSGESPVSCSAEPAACPAPGTAAMQGGCRQESHRAGVQPPTAAPPCRVLALLPKEQLPRAQVHCTEPTLTQLYTLMCRLVIVSGVSNQVFLNV